MCRGCRTLLILQEFFLYKNFQSKFSDKCPCLPRYYDNLPASGSAICEPCSMRCDTCEGTFDFCLSCPDPMYIRIATPDTNNKCPYIERYIDNFDMTASYVCEKCDYTCWNCFGRDELECLTCGHLTRIPIPNNLD